MLTIIFVGFGLAVAPSTSPADAMPTAGLSEVTVATRINVEAQRTLLFTVKKYISGQKVDEVRLELPKDAARQVIPGYLPSGWTLTSADRVVTLSGRLSDNPQQFFFRLNIGNARAPNRLKVRLFSRGDMLYDKKVAVESGQPLTLTDNLEGLLVLPPRVFPGEELEFEILDTTRTPPEGVWRICGNQGRSFMPSPDDLGRNPHVALNLPGTLNLDDPVSVSYTDPWNELTVDVPAVTDIEVVLPPAQYPVSPIVRDCATRVFPGNLLCVCGMFPDRTAWNGLMMDGSPLGPPVSSSNTTLWFRIPQDMAAGKHVIAGDPTVGFSESDGAGFEVVIVSGSIDQEDLWRGQSTPIRISLDGTEEPVALRLRNETPDIVSLEGGDEQVLTTSGGSDNHIEKEVRGKQVGDFNISYELDAGACPCADDESQSTGATRTRTRSGPRNLAEWNEVLHEVSESPRLQDNSVDDGAINFCGPDITGAYIESLQRAKDRLDRINGAEHGAYDGTQFLARNGIGVDMQVRPAIDPDDEGKELSQSDYRCPTGKCAGDNPTGQTTFTLAGICLPKHIGNEIMVGFAAALLDVPMEILVMGAHAHELISHGGFEPSGPHAAYALGYNTAKFMRSGGELSGTSLGVLMDQTQLHLSSDPVKETVSPFHEGDWTKFADVIKAENPWIISCVPCPFPGRGLNKDWSTSDWSLSDGSKAEYRGSGK